MKRYTFIKGTFKDSTETIEKLNLEANLRKFHQKRSDFSPEKKRVARRIVACWKRTKESTSSARDGKVYDCPSRFQIACSAGASILSTFRENSTFAGIRNFALRQRVETVVDERYTTACRCSSLFFHVCACTSCLMKRVALSWENSTAISPFSSDCSFIVKRARYEINFCHSSMPRR